MGSLNGPVAAHKQRAHSLSHGRSRGFTLLELLVVLVLAGIMLGMVSFNAMPGTRQALQNDAQRIALLLQLARDEAIVRNRPIAFEADTQGYRFLIRDNNTWQLLTGDELLRPREFQRAPVQLLVTPQSAATANPFRIVFGREPVDQPFVMSLAAGNARVDIQANGIGQFSVE